MDEIEQKDMVCTKGVHDLAEKTKEIDALKS